MAENSVNKRNLTCIVCPRGCSIEVMLDGNEILSVSGNLCVRGKKYAENECTHPMRTVTTTIKTSNGGVISVKTKDPIPKEKMLECLKKINSVTIDLPVSIGDVLISDVYGTNIIATQNKN